MATSANEIKRDGRHASPTAFHYRHYECIRRHGDEVNDKAADDDDDESSLSLDQ